MRSILFASAALLLAAVVSAEDVVVGNKDNFESLISKDELTLVKFYAPWCGHCKKMAPDFQDAASELKGKATLVDLDATVEKELAEKYEIRGFPTIKLFSKGEVISDYKGGRTKDDIIKYMERALLPSFTECADADAVTKFLEEHKGKTIFFGVALDKLAADFKKITMSIRDVSPDTTAFGSVADVELLKSKSDEVAADTVLVIRDDESVSVFSGDAADLAAWGSTASIPLFGELSRDTAALYTELETPTFILFQDPEKKDEDVNKVITDIAKSHRGSGKIIFAWINSVELKSFAEHVGVADKNPAIVVYEFKTDAKFIFDVEYTADALKTWVDDFIAGKIEMTTKSEPIPETNDEPVKIVVGDSWEDIVEDESKDVLIEQYAPWCGHCKQLAPILDELAKDLEGVKTLVIAKMDATANDAPKDYKAQGFPTLHFFPAGSKKGVTYDGGRTKEDFVKFFKENATHKEGIELSEKSGDEDKTDEKEEL